MNTSTPCPKCQGEMKEGFILDAPRFVSRWVAGKPQFSFWTGTKIVGREQHPIQSFRCANCGYLESYANGPI